MKIWLFITNLQGGGAERALINLATWLGERGHQVQLILFEDRVEYRIPPSISLSLLGPPKRRISKGWLGKQIAAWRLRQWVRRKPASDRPDLVISTLPFADEIVQTAGLQNVWYRISNPISVQISALQAMGKDKAGRRLERFRRLYENQRLIAISEGIAADLRDRLHLRNATITVVYNPFDFDEIKRQAALPDPDIPNEPYIVHAGRFVRQKRHDVLLDAFAATRIPHRLVLLTPPTAELLEMIAARHLTGRVTIAGFRPNPFPWLARASVLVHSSDFEGLGNVLIEALACGTPVVSTDFFPDAREILRGSLDRYLSPRGNAAALARNLEACIVAPPVIDPGVLSPFSKDATLDAIERLIARGQR